MGTVGISETSSAIKKPAMETISESQAASDWLNQHESDPAHQEFLAGIMTDEPSLIRARQTEVRTCCNVLLFD